VRGNLISVIWTNSYTQKTVCQVARNGRHVWVQTAPSAGQAKLEHLKPRFNSASSGRQGAQKTRSAVSLVFVFYWRCANATVHQLDGNGFSELVGNSVVYFSGFRSFNVAFPEDGAVYTETCREICET
jgi:hypothetical protein